MSSLLLSLLVFTGALDHPGQNRSQLVRIFFLPDESALVKMEFGIGANPEYVTLRYPKIHYNAAKKIIFLTPEAHDPQTEKLPAIVLDLVSPEKLEGSWFSIQTGGRRKIQLAKGWLPQGELRNEKTLAPLEGFYAGNCNAGTNLRLRGIYLTPSRNAGALGYVGTTYCDYRGEIRSCGDLQGGVFRYFWGDLVLTKGIHPWHCHRTDDNTLDCTTPQAKSCVLKRAGDDAAPLAKVELPRHLSPPFKSSDATCESWNKRFSGVLRHAFSDREQPVALNLTTVEAENGCAVAGSGALFFGSSEENTERIPLSFPYQEFKGGRLVIGGGANDLIFDLSKDKDVVEGHVYSKQFGFVGDMKATGKDARALIEHPIPLLTGKYKTESERGFQLHLYAGPAIAITGWLELNLGTISGTPSVVENGSYDYFTNHLVVTTTNKIYAGGMNENGMDVVSLGRIFLGVERGLGPVRQLWGRSTEPL